MGDLSSNFSRREFACNCQCGKDTVDAELILILEEIRWGLNSNPITITSGVRCKSHNKAIGGAPHSQHLLGRAADFTVANIPSENVQLFLTGKYAGKYGVGAYEDRTHVDSRKAYARWSNRWKKDSKAK